MSVRQRLGAIMGHAVSARHARLLLPALGASYFLFGTASLAVIGLLEAMASAWQVTPARIAELVAVHSLTFALAAPLLQILFGHRPRRELISGGCCCWASAPWRQPWRRTGAQAWPHGC